jgi:hypothetical protein
MNADPRLNRRVSRLLALRECRPQAARSSSVRRTAAPCRAALNREPESRLLGSGSLARMTSAALGPGPVQHDDVAAGTRPSHVALAFQHADGRERWSG